MHPNSFMNSIFGFGPTRLPETDVDGLQPLEHALVENTHSSFAAGMYLLVQKSWKRHCSMERCQRLHVVTIKHQL